MRERGGRGGEERQRRREREGGYHTNVRSIVISVSILFGLITEEASVDGDDDDDGGAGDW